MTSKTRGLLRAAGPTLQPPVDFKHWANCDRLTASEAAYLLMGKDPDEPGFMSPGDQKKLKQINKILERSQGLFVDDMVSPFALFEWVRSRRIAVKPEFIDAVLLLEHAKREYQSKARQRNTCDDNETKTHILELEERLAEKDRELQALRDKLGEELHPDGECYAEELDVAKQAHRYVSKNPGDGTVSQQIESWVQQHYSLLSKAAIERIVKVANWDKKGGRPPAK